MVSAAIKSKDNRDATMCVSGQRFLSSLASCCYPDPDMWPLWGPAGLQGWVGALLPLCQICHWLTTILGWTRGSRGMGCAAVHVLFQRICTASPQQLQLFRDRNNFLQSLTNGKSSSF